MIIILSGYTRAKEYIVTEWPMVHTVPDCWSLIYDHNCNSVVVLGTPPDDNVSVFYNYYNFIIILQLLLATHTHIHVVVLHQ